MPLRTAAYKLACSKENPIKEFHFIVWKEMNDGNGVEITTFKLIKPTVQPTNKWAERSRSKDNVHTSIGGIIRENQHYLLIEPENFK